MVLVELGAMVLRRQNMPNQWLYNVLGVADILVYHFVFHQMVNRVRNRILIKFFLFISLLLVSIEGLVFSEPPFYEFLNYAFSIGSMLIALSAMLFLRELVETDKILHLKHVLSFWVSIGLLFYHLCNLPITVLSNVLPNLMTKTSALLLIQIYAGILMYSCFILGFIWSKTKYNS